MPSLMANVAVIFGFYVLKLMHSFQFVQKFVTLGKFYKNIPIIDLREDRFLRNNKVRRILQRI